MTESVTWLDVAGARDVIRNVVQECVAVAHGCGVAVPEDILEKTLALGLLDTGFRFRVLVDVNKSVTDAIEHLIQSEISSLRKLPECWLQLHAITRSYEAELVQMRESQPADLPAESYISRSP